MLQRTLPAGFIAPWLPTKTDKLPSGSQWLHEIKHDGFRIIARKTGAHVGTMVSVVGVNGYAPGIRDRVGRALLERAGCSLTYGHDGDRYHHHHRHHLRAAAIAAVSAKNIIVSVAS